MKNSLFLSIRIAAIALLLASSVLPNFMLGLGGQGGEGSVGSIVSADYTAPYDLIVDKSVDGFDADAGWIDYKITYENDSAATLTDVYVNDIVPEGLTFGGVPLSNPLLGAPVMPIIPDGDPLTSDVNIIREGITLTPGQIGEMIVRFTIDAGADLPNVVNEAKAGVATSDTPGPVCDPYVSGSESTQAVSNVVPLPPVIPADDPGFDLSIAKVVTPGVNGIDPVSGLPLFFPGNLVTFENTVCYDDFSSPKDEKTDIFVADYYPANLVYVSDTAPVPYDQLTDSAVVWRSFPIGENDVPPCVTFDVTYEILNIEGPISTSANIGTTSALGGNSGPLGESDSGNNIASSSITTQGFDLSITKKAIKIVRDGIDISAAQCDATGCGGYEGDDEVTFELAYTLDGVDRTDIVVMDILPGSYLSSDPVASNENTAGGLDTIPSAPADTVPNYTTNYAYRDNLSLADGETKVVEITIKLPSTTCSPTALGNTSYVSIAPYDNAVEDAVIYPIITSAAPGDENTSVTYLDPDTQEIDVTNNVSNTVDVSIGGDNVTGCVRARETDLILDSKTNNVGGDGATVYPGQIIEYTIDYSNAGDERGYVYIDDLFDSNQLEFVEMVSAGSLRQVTDSPVFDRWNSQEYIDSQAAALMPYFLETSNDAANYLANVYYGTDYYEHIGLDNEESINLYCRDRNPEYNELMANVVDQYTQLYMGNYNDFLAQGFTKDAASIDATIKTMWEIKLRVDANFDPSGFNASIEQCVYEGQYQLALADTLSPSGSAITAQNYIDNPTGPFRTRMLDGWDGYAGALYWMNPIHTWAFYGGNSTNGNIATTSFYGELGREYYHYHKNRATINQGIQNNNGPYITTLFQALANVDLQFKTTGEAQLMSASNYALSHRHSLYQNNANYNSYYASMTAGTYFDGISKKVFWDTGEKQSISTWLQTASGQGYGTTSNPEYEGNKNISYAEHIAQITGGLYGTGNKFANTSTSQYRGGNILPGVLLDDYTSSDAVSLHNLFLGEDGSGSVTYKFKVREDIYTQGFVAGDEICNTALIATNRGLNLQGTNGSVGYTNGEYMFGCDATGNLVTGNNEHDNYQLEYMSRGTGAGEQTFCNENNPENTTLFSRHDEEFNDGGTRDGRTNVAIFSETIPGANNFQEHCVELGLVEYEMSVTKSSLANTYNPGDTITYAIEACNEGTIAMPKMFVKDFIPAGLTYVGGVTYNTVSSEAGTIKWEIPNVNGGDCVTINPQFSIASDFSGTTITNDVEITAELNGVEVGDLTPTDNASDDDVSITQPVAPSYPPAPAEAISKSLDPAASGTGNAGDIMEYVLTFANNETVPAYFNLTDTYSSNLIFVAADTINGVAPDSSTTGEITWANIEVPANSTETFTVRMQIDPNATDREEYTNDFSYDYYAIYECNDGDTNPANNADSTDLPFDLALTKKLTPDLAKSQYSAGDDVSFDIELYNQGIIDATDVLIADDIPAAGSCFSFDPAKNAGWSQVGAQAQYTHPSLAAGDSVIVPLVFTISASCQELQLTNFAEIGAANDSNGDPATDIDSDPDTNLTNDGEAEDDVIDESGKDGNDEDDHDYAVVNLAQNFDLAITKTLITEGPYHGGDLVTYEVIISNQGTLDGNNVEIIDYILAGFNFDPSYGNNTAEGWTTSGANAVATVPLVPAMGASITKEITVQLAFGFEGEELANVVAITEDNAGEDYGLKDLDSDPGNEDTDGDGIPDIIDDDIDGDGIPNDEDDDEDGDGTPNDQDPDFNDTEDDVAPEYITLGNEMDLSLDKSVDTTASPGPYVAGSTVVFNIDVTNDTDIDAYAVDVTDYIDPAMFIFTPNNGWIDDGMGNAIQTIPFLTGLDSTQLMIELTINPNFVGTALENSAEISAFDDDTNPDNEPPTDVDSNPDSDNNNDDDDEDDEDTVDLPFDFYDLALTKVLSGPGPYYPGDTISFEIEVFNQGTLDAADVQVTDYTPAGLILTGADWIEVGGNAVYEYMMIGAGESDIITIDYVIDPTYTGVGETNRAEISGDDASTYGDDVQDIDSNPDAENTDVFGSDDQTNSDGGNLDTDGDGIIDSEDDDIDGDGIPNDLDDDDDGDGILDEDEAVIDEDDHDPAEYAVSHIYDLALTKTFESSDPTPIVPGGDVTYTITVYNQGTWIADDIEVTDYLNTNLILNDSNWTLNGSGFAVYNSLLGPIPAGDTQEVTITTTIDPNFTGGSITNNAEISDDDSEENGFTDIDSTADGNNVNDPSNDDNATDGDGTLDEDDHDPETITVDVYDLAIQKTINTVATQMPVYPGDDIFYTIEVFNQGTLAAENVEVTDYTPDGLTLADPNWTLVNGNPTYLMEGPIVAGGSETIDIRFTIDIDFTGTSFTNISEISDDNSEDYGTQDPDSVPDADNENDPFGEDNQLDGDGGTGDADGDGIPDDQDDDIDGDGIPNDEDDDIDGDGIPNDEETGDDEDDSDLAVAMIGQTYDLALTKTLDEENTQMPVVPGGDVTFLVTVMNQGTLPAANIELTDTLPAALILNDTDWVGSGTQAIYTYTGTILPGASDIVPITVTIDPSYMGGNLKNNAEISGDDSDLYGTSDEDSTPDGDPTNDAEGDDGQTDGDGTDDEDDHDWFDLEVEVYDLALTKAVNAVATDFPVYPGDAITYTMTVFNQGTLPASNVELTDYTPDGLTLNDPTWTLVNGNPTYQLAGPIVPGGQMEVDITFMIDIDFTGTSFQNIAEISDDNSEDFGTADPDSDPDAINDDVLGEDNQLDGDGTDDSDDSDPADVMIGQIYDLSLDKAINEELTDFPVFPGDEVTYTITVTNEGTLPAADLEITDYTPDGLILNDADWTLVGTDAVMVIDGPILPGANTSVDITFIIDPEFTGYTFTNNAEITKDDADVYGTTDIDSAPGNGPNQEEDDDDDDVQVLNVDQIYDLALTKTLDESQLPVYPGDDVTFTFTIDNQGTLPAANIELTDYTPSGLTLNDADWTSVGNNAQTVFAGPIPAGSSATVEITYTINLDAYGNSITNRGEISDDDSELYDITDIDSDPDADNGNDNYGADDQTDGNGGNIDTDGDGILDIYDTDTDGDGILDVNDDDDDGDGIPDAEDTDADEDDADPAILPLSQIYDLALTKVLNTTATNLPVYPGDAVVYTLSLINQGTLPAANIEVSDYVPTGLVLNDTAWTLVGDTATTLYTDTILPGETATVDIAFTIDPAFTGTSFRNNAEISDDDSELYTDEFGELESDIDSQADAEFGNDAEGDDDQVDGDGSETSDEDDADWHDTLIGQIYDLALTKTLVTEGPFQVGTQVTFELNVINQGTLPAADIELTDYTPAGLKLDDYDWTSVGGNAVYDLAGPILAGESMIVEITYVIVSDIAPITNTAEISADDSAVYGTTDIDSIADDTATNDAYGEDNQTDGNGTDDEDDSDIALIDFTVTAPATNTSGGNNGSSNNNSGNSGSSGSSGGSSSSNSGGGSSNSSSNSGGASSTFNSAPVAVEPSPAPVIVIEESVVLTETDLEIVNVILDKKVEAEAKQELHNSANSLEGISLLDLPTILPNTGAEIK